MAIAAVGGRSAGQIGAFATVAGIGRIAGNGDVDREAVLGGDDAIDLPVAERRAGERRGSAFEERKLVVEASG